MVMSSCGDDDETAPAVAVLAPTLSVSVNGSQVATGATVNVETGTAVTFSITANRVGSGKDLNTMTITQNGDNVVTPFNIQAGASDPYNFADGSAQALKNADDETFQGTGVFNDITRTVGSTTYTITVIDRDELSTTVRVTIAVADPTTPLSTMKSGYFYHVGGSLAGRWNVSTDTSIAGTGTLLENTDVAGDPFTGAFDLSMGSTMVVGSASNYDNATVESAEATYNAGTAVTANNTPVVNDVYVVKTATGDYIVIKVTDINAADNTCVCGNRGKMSFIYKKA
ncbi:MAG: hypothetical protein ACJAV5_001854 [Vicingaceae bacterium]|jgi:hypothetical protein